MVKRLLSGLLVFFTMMIVMQKVEAVDDADESFYNRTAGMAEIKNLRYNIGNGRVRIVLDVTKKIEYREAYLENPSRIVIDIDNAWIGRDIPREIELKSTAASKCRIAQFDKNNVRLVIETSAENNIFYLNGGEAGGRLVIDIGAEAEQPNFEQKINKGNDNEVDKPFEKTKSISKGPDNGGSINTSPAQTKPVDLNKVPDGVPEYNSDDKASAKSKKEKVKKEKKSKKKKEKKEDAKDNKEELDKRLEDLTSLEGITIVIDPGHGGNDAGAIGPSGVMEKTVTLRVSLILAQLLENEGAEVIMTRNTDTEVAARGRHATDIEELKSRCDIANEAEADIFLSIHADSFTNPASRGTTCYYFAEGSPESKKLAEKVHAALIEQIKTPSRGIKGCNFYVVRNTDMPAILVELAFISNPQEEKLLNSKEGVEQAAQGIFDGIEDYFG